MIAADGPLNPYLAPAEELMGPFMKNRHDVVSRCIDVGINLIDLAGDSQMICIPYTSNTKALPEDSMLDTAVKLDVGILGIKPFASNSLFRGDGSPDGPHVEEDNRIARMAIRYILNNPAITAPIPGLISPAQVDNMKRAIQERRQLDLAERMELDRASKRAWANLPRHYEWLKDWEYV